MTDYMEMIQNRQIAPPVKVVGLANDMGIRVWSTKNLTSDISGKLYPDEKLGGTSGYAILVNENHPETRQRFTIAHEIAHFVLHKDLVGTGIVDNTFYRSRLSNAQEVEANNLGADILMPYPLILEICKRDQITFSGSEESYLTTFVSKLASIFKVSERAMSIRLGIIF